MGKLLAQKNPEQEVEETINQTEECLKFLALSHLTSGSIPVNQKVDKIWHMLILETKAYAELCEKLPGNKFIHHTSDVFSQYKAFTQEDSENESKRYLEWLVTYVAHFGNFTEVSAKYWPFAVGIMKFLNLNIYQFNEKLKQLIHK